MNDKMTPDKERENCPCRKAIINPFDAMMMVVVRRLDKAYLELKRSKPPAKEAEFALRNAKLSFYGELVRQSIETVFSPEEIIALYENDDLAGGAWTVWNDIGCPVDKILIKHIVDTKGFDYIKANFQYSVLENYNARMDDNYILSREKWWKDTLCTRQFGYNKN